MCMQVDDVFYPETPVKQKLGPMPDVKVTISYESVGIFIWV